MQSRVLLLGPGRLGGAIARRLAELEEVGELVIAARRDGVPAALLDAAGRMRIRFVEIDLRSRSDLERLLRRARPDLLVQCACDVSPWWVSEQPDPFWTALGRAGFALQLPFQLPLLRTVMEAVRTADFRGPVVNASYPDLTHPILATCGLEPSIGVGNAGMIELRIRAAFRRRNFEAEPVRVVAHHAHVTPMVLATPPDLPATRPRVYLGDDGVRADDLAFTGPPLPNDWRLCELSAAAAVPVVRALLGTSPVRLSTPAPMGLPGGWPVRISAGEIALDLPPGTGREELIAFQWQSARADGIDHIDGEGTVFFTDEARAAMKRWPELAQPLSSGAAPPRHAID
jgi:Saccharopine dehydrogenase NADP binding domain